MTDYKPIECGLHDEYELAIMQRRRLRLEWRDASGQACSDTVMPTDLVTENSEEFLLARGSNGENLRVRLDHITFHGTRPGS